MNKLKITIKDDSGYTIVKLGSSVKTQLDYSDLDLAYILQDMAHSIKHELKRDCAKSHQQLTFDFF